MMDLKQRANNAMIGLAIGNAMSWTAMFHRSYLLPLWTRRTRREIDIASEKTNVILSPMPFSLNQPSQHFDISPTCATEWAAFSAGILLNNNFGSYSQSVLKEWMKLAHSTDCIRGGISTQAALQNLRNGIEPPQSGKENPHYFDDGSMPRSVPIGIICAGQPDKAASLAEKDASVTNSEDGVWAAQAMAVAISLVCSGKDITYSIDSASKYLPESSWVKRTVDEAHKIVKYSSSIFSVLPELHNNVVNREYSYGNIAPETLAITFAIARLQGENFETALMTASSFAKCGETLPAMVGALVGAMNSMPLASKSWLDSIKLLKGICIPSLAGMNYFLLIEQLSNFEDQKISV